MLLPVAAESHRDNSTCTRALDAADAGVYLGAVVIVSVEILHKPKAKSFLVGQIVEEVVPVADKVVSEGEHKPLQPGLPRCDLAENPATHTRLDDEQTFVERRRVEHAAVYRPPDASVEVLRLARMPGLVDRQPPAMPSVSALLPVHTADELAHLHFVVMPLPQHVVGEDGIPVLSEPVRRVGGLLVALAAR